MRESQTGASTILTNFFNSSRPATALFILSGPSKKKGLVTIPTVKHPDSLHTLAITGAAPVPVPPPIPQAIKTILASLTTSLIESSSSRAAFLPTSGLAPAPSPLVEFLPIITLVSAFDVFKS